MAIDPAKVMLKWGKTALLICDVQTKVSRIISEFDKMVLTTSKLIQSCKLMNIPMLVTEQTPELLGATIPEYNISGAKGPFAKTQFSMCTPEVNEALSKMISGEKPEHVLLVGLDVNSCLEMTAIDLCARGYQVHPVADCISAKTQEDKILALDRMRQMGCMIGSMENVIFKMVESSNEELFRTLLHVARPPVKIEHGLSSKL